MTDLDRPRHKPRHRLDRGSTASTPRQPGLWLRPGRKQKLPQCVLDRGQAARDPRRAHQAARQPCWCCILLRSRDSGSRTRLDACIVAARIAGIALSQIQGSDRGGGSGDSGGSGGSGRGAKELAGPRRVLVSTGASTGCVVHSQTRQPPTDNSEGGGTACRWHVCRAGPRRRANMHSAATPVDDQARSNASSTTSACS